MGIQDGVAPSRRSVAFGIVFALVLMVLSFFAALSTTHVQAQSSGCSDPDNVDSFSSSQGQTTEPFRIRGDEFRISFDTERRNSGNSRVEVTVFEDGQPTGESFVVRNGDDGSEIIDLGPGTFQLEIQAENARYDIDVDDCLGEPASNAQNQTTTAQNQTTTAQNQTTTAETTTADANLNASANRPDAENFQCEFFLRSVRDEGGALRRQYRDDELIVQRFEQCVSANDVIRDTIPDRRLPFTGGPALPLGGGALFLVAAALLAARIIRR